MKKLVFVLIALLGIAAGAYAQATANAPTSATIVTPISITKQVDMNFGNIATNGTAGTVVLATTGSRTAGTGVTLPVVAGTVTAAQFKVDGEGTYTYDITLPTTLTITKVASSETMIVNTFVSDPSTSGALTGGTQTLKVGATLNLGASQVAGTYTNATGFPVTVNYN